MEDNKKIIELIESALKCDDFNFRINFLVGGMMSADSNDTEDKIRKNKNWLSIIAEYSSNYTGSPEKENYLSHLSKSISEFLNSPEE